MLKSIFFGKKSNGSAQNGSMPNRITVLLHSVCIVKTVAVERMQKTWKGGKATARPFQVQKSHALQKVSLLLGKMQCLGMRKLQGLVAEYMDIEEEGKARDEDVGDG
jgi:hypothetical protein